MPKNKSTKAALPPKKPQNLPSVNPKNRGQNRPSSSGKKQTVAAVPKTSSSSSSCSSTSSTSSSSSSPEPQPVSPALSTRKASVYSSTASSVSVNPNVDKSKKPGGVVNGTSDKVNKDGKWWHEQLSSFLGPLTTAEKVYVINGDKNAEEPRTQVVEVGPTVKRSEREVVNKSNQAVQATEVKMHMFPDAAAMTSFLSGNTTIVGGKVAVPARPVVEKKPVQCESKVGVDAGCSGDGLKTADAKREKSDVADFVSGLAEKVAALEALHREVEEKFENCVLSRKHDETKAAGDVASVANADELAHGSSVVDALLQNLENVAVKHVSYSLIEDLLRMVAEHRPNTVDEKGTVEGQEEVVRRTKYAKAFAKTEAIESSTNGPLLSAVRHLLADVRLIGDAFKPPRDSTDFCLELVRIAKTHDSAE